MFEAQTALFRAICTYLIQIGIHMNADAARVRLEYDSGLMKDSDFRRRLAVVYTRWGDRVFQQAARNLKFSADFDLPEPLPGPFILISNHQQSLDSAILFRLLTLMGLTHTRWLMKDQILSLPVLGRLGVDSGCIPVKRSRDPADIERVRAGAELAFQEGAGVGIFPEGTRFRPELVKGTQLKHVLPPHRTGFATVLKAMPTAPVLVVTLNWNTPLGRTMFDAGSLYGAALKVKARYASAEDVNANPNWLTDTWIQMDHELDQA